MEKKVSDKVLEKAMDLINVIHVKIGIITDTA